MAYDPARRLREPRLLTEAQAAEILGVAPRTLRRWRTETHTAPAHLRIGSQVRYAPAVIAKYIAEQQTKSQ